VGLIWYVFAKKQVSLATIFDAFAQASPFYLGVAFFLHIIGLWISAYRWQILLRIQNIQRSQLDLASLYLEGFFFNTFLPGSFSGDVVRAYRASTQKLKSAAVILVERGSGIFFLFLFVSVATIFWGDRIPGSIRLKPYLAPISLALTVFLLLVLLGLIFWGHNNKKEITTNNFLLSKIYRFHEALKIYRNQKGILLKVFTLSFLLQLNVVVHYFFVMRSLQVHVPLTYAFFAIPIIHFVLMLPISISGIGVRENAFIYMLKPEFCQIDATAVAVSWVAWAMVLVFALLGGIFHVLRKQ
jgi:uncharacterized protein (TIRG00374 family)